MNQPHTHQQTATAETQATRAWTQASRRWLLWLSGIRIRLLFTIATCVGITASILGMCAIGMGYMAEDRILLARLHLAEQAHRAELESASQQDATHHASTGDALISAYNTPQDAGPALAGHLQNLTVGVHEWVNDALSDVAAGPRDGYERVIAVRDIPKHGRWWYVYDTTALESNAAEQSRGWLTLAIACGLAALSCAGAVWALSRWLFDPLRRLAAASASSSNDYQNDLASQFAHDEIGEVAAAFDRAQQQLRIFLQRERDFTRDASHELRTPVTVIEGALDIVSANIEELPPAQQRAVARMRRACVTMRMQIEAFLTLAREPDDADLEEVQLASALEQAIERNRWLIDERGLHVRVGSLIDGTTRAPRAVTLIVIDNLIRNATQHSTGDDIRIYLLAGRLTVSNDADLSRVPDRPLSEHVSGGGSTGLGLSVVAGLCERCGWQLDCRVEQDAFTITIDFAHSYHGQTALNQT